MRVLKGIGIWFLSVMVILYSFDTAISLLQLEKDAYLSTYQIIILIVPIVLAVIFSKKRMKKSEDKGVCTEIEDDAITMGNRIIIKRKGQISGSAVRHKIYLDGIIVGKLQSGGKLAIDIAPGNHSILVTGIWKQRATLNFFVSSQQINTYIVDELDLIKSNIKLSIIKDEAKDSLHSTSCDTATKDPPVMLSNVKIDTQNYSTSSPIRVKDRDPMEIIRIMERRFEEQYQFAYTHLFNLHDCQRMYEQTVIEFDSIELPLMAQIRFEQLCAEYKEKFNITNPMVVVDAMDGHTFEKWCAELLRKNGFVDVQVTPGSRDQGVDVVAEKEGVRYAIQCKCYSADLGNTPVQEVFAGKEYYGCQVGVVMTNRYFTSGAKELAAKTRVLLWDRTQLEKFIAESANTECDN